MAYCRDMPINRPYQGHLITEARERKGLTLRNLAGLLDADTRDVQRWESGSTLPRAMRLANLCRLLDLNITDLCATDGDASAAA